MATDYGVLNIGLKKESDKDWVSIDDNSRRANMAVYGIKNTGKAHTITPFLFKQDVQRKDSGITFVVGTPQLAFELYTIGKHSKRKVTILKPSVNFNVLNKLLFAEKWDYEMINNEIINYKQAIKNADIVIIDMEREKYGMHAVKATAMLLMQLQTDMSEIEETNKERHYVYVDDAATFLPYMTSLLKYGEMFNISSIFFFNSRSEFKKKEDYTDLVDNNVRNYVLLQGLNYDDAKYFAKRMTLFQEKSEEDNVQYLLNRKYGEFAYEILSPKTFIRECGLGKLVELPEEERNSISTNAKRHRKSLLKNMKDTLVSKHMQMTLEENKIAELSEALNVKKDDSLIGKLEKEITASISEDEVNKELKEEIKTPVEKKESPVKEIKEDVQDDVIAQPELPEEPEIETPVLTEPDFDNIDDSVLEGIDENEIENQLNEIDEPQVSEIDATNLLDEIDIPSITVPSKGPYEEEIDKAAEADPLSEIGLGEDMSPEQFSLVEEPETYQDIELDGDKATEFEFDLGDSTEKKHYYPYQRIKNKTLEDEMNKLFKI